ncbi:hypothetical protein ANN_20542 [Periplaneta americana]|uniref:Uncharacterized protein n=1 Tax=Periplaneta americana TaxID=6978 RepID=A0ABQ8SCY5_PERAM|nr:hypothetical protein ANN_20542 [Periplaneta americana]
MSCENETSKVEEMTNEVEPAPSTSVMTPETDIDRRWRKEEMETKIPVYNLKEGMTSQQRLQRKQYDAPTLENVSVFTKEEALANMFYGLTPLDIRRAAFEPEEDWFSNKLEKRDNHYSYLCDAAGGYVSPMSTYCHQCMSPVLQKERPPEILYSCTKNGNGRAARRLYRDRYPQHPTPSHTLFAIITQRLRERGTFTASRNDCGALRRCRTPELEEAVLHQLEGNPSTST